MCNGMISLETNNRLNLLGEDQKNRLIKVINGGGKITTLKTRSISFFRSSFWCRWVLCCSFSFLVQRFGVSLAGSFDVYFPIQHF